MFIIRNLGNEIKVNKTSLFIYCLDLKKRLYFFILQRNNNTSKLIFYLFIFVQNPKRDKIINIKNCWLIIYINVVLLYQYIRLHIIIK